MKVLNRLKVDYNSLREMVTEIVAVTTNNKDVFSGHDITVAVRNLVGPAVEIGHEFVNACVKEVMRGIFNYTAVDNGNYIEYKPIKTFVVEPAFTFKSEELPVHTLEVGKVKYWNSDYFESLESSLVRKAWYSNDSKRLIIEFKSGKIWLYDGVSKGTWDGFKDSGSKGHFFHICIKDEFKESALN